MCQFLEQNKCLETLSLAGNSAGDEGCIAIAKYMESDTHVTVLDLSGNCVGDEGARAIAEMLRRNTTITTLNLNSNVIDYEVRFYPSQKKKLFIQVSKDQTLSRSRADYRRG